MHYSNVIVASALAGSALATPPGYSEKYGGSTAAPVTSEPAATSYPHGYGSSSSYDPSYSSSYAAPVSSSYYSSSSYVPRPYGSSSSSYAYPVSVSSSSYVVSSSDVPCDESSSIYAPISSSVYIDPYPSASSSYAAPVSSSHVPYYPPHDPPTNTGPPGGYPGKGQCYHGDPGFPAGPGNCAPDSYVCPGEIDGFCLSDADAQAAADVFQGLIQNYSDELALAALAEDFEDWTSSIAFIIEQVGEGDLNLLEPAFTSREAFMAAQGTQPEIPFTQTHVFHGCNSVSMRWYTTRSAAGQDTETARIPVVGLAIMEVVPAEAGAPYNFRIQRLFSELNTGAWLINLGVFKDHSDGASLNKRGLLNGIPRA